MTTRLKRALQCQIGLRLRLWVAALRGLRVIPRVLMETNAACNNKCAHCTADAMIRHNPAYQLSLEQLAEFLRATRESHYYIHELLLHGPGEVTLWQHLNAGITMLGESGHVGRIILTTNGAALQRLDRRAWHHVYYVMIDDYGTGPDPLLQVPAAYRWKCHRVRVDKFYRLPEAEDSFPIPAPCGCSGPMYYDGHIYHCGPPMWRAALLSGCAPTLLGAPLGRWYSDSFGPRDGTGAMEICKRCSANDRQTRTWVPHQPGASHSHNHNPTRSPR